MNQKRSRLAFTACNGKLIAVGGFDGNVNLNSVEMYDPEKNQWTLIASMIAHEGVVAVSVLPIDVDLLIATSNNINNSSQILASNDQLTNINNNNNNNHTRREKSSSNSGQQVQNKQLLSNYYLMEEEDDEENRYSTILSPLNLHHSSQNPRNSSQ
jgi:hypothetical protein